MMRNVSVSAVVAMVLAACVGPGSGLDSADEDASDLRKTCGNGRCDGRESCGTCARDCGTCPVPETDAGADDAGAPSGGVAPTGPAVAFPGAEGPGAISRGGRGGAVLEITNLDDAGPGSLRACATAAGPRTCVFRVGGTIDLTSEITITNPYLTIAGQTAPGGGVLLRGTGITTGVAPIMIKTHDVVIRYLRSRLGRNPALTSDSGALLVYGAAGQKVENIVVDHCSFSWGNDENIGVWSQGAHIKNLTFSHNISSEGFGSKGAIVGSHVADARLNMTGISFHRNYFAHNDERNPYFGVAQQAATNNVIYNWGSGAGIQVRGGLTVDIVGNLTKPGPSSDRSSNPDDIMWFPYESTTCEQATYCIAGAPSLYVAKNAGYVSGVLAAPADNWPMLEGWTSTTGEFAVPTSYRRTTPLAMVGPPVASLETTTLAEALLPKIGASERLDCSGRWVSARDSVDVRVVDDYWRGTGALRSSEADVGGFPSIAGGVACADTDHDGMPDAWETSFGLNPADATDRNGDLDGDGYTNLEEYLAGLGPR